MPQSQMGNGGGGNKALIALLIAVAVGAAVALSVRNLNRVDADKLDRDGPQLPEEFNMSNLTLKAFVRGDWPLFIAYELEQPGDVTLKVKVKDRPDFVFVFDGKQPGRHEQLIRLPASLGDLPEAATYNIKATSPGHPSRSVPLYLYSLGAGDNAVGSSGFESIDFQPGTVAVNQNGRASYTFRSKKDFSKVAAEFMLLARNQQKEIIASRVNQQSFDRGVRVGESRGGDWDCKNAKRRASLGLHQLTVRGWRGRPDGADWMIDTSYPRRVFIQ